SYQAINELMLDDSPRAKLQAVAGRSYRLRALARMYCPSVQTHIQDAGLLLVKIGRKMVELRAAHGGPGTGLGEAVQEQILPLSREANNKLLEAEANAFAELEKPEQSSLT